MGLTTFDRFCQEFGESEIDQITPDDVLSFLNRLTSYDKELAFRVIKKVNGYSTISEGTVEYYMDADITEYPTDYWRTNNFNVVCGDVDGNGESETLIAYNGSIFLMGDSSKNYAEMGRKDYKDNKSTDTDYILIKVSSGDLDNNGTDELVVVVNTLEANPQFGSATYHIYTGTGLAELDSDTISKITWVK